MIFDGRSLDDISLDDIRLLIENQVPKGPHLDYRETPCSDQPRDKREMLREVVALANAEGGYLVLGIQEDGTGRPTRLIPFDDPQRICQSIRQVCLDGVRDRIEGLQVRAFEAGFNQGIIVIRVPPSDQCPHMMTLDGRTDFYRRYDTETKRP